MQERFEQIMEAGKGGKFFSVKFIKRSNGAERFMNCRLGVTKHLKGGPKAYDDKVHKLVTVFDVQANGYRCIPLESVREINGKKV